MRGGGFIGPALGGALGLIFGLRAAFLAFALFTGLTLLLVMFNLDDDHEKEKNDAPPESHRGHLFRVLKDHWRILGIAGIAQIFALTIRAGRPVIVALYGADVLGMDVGAIGAMISLGTAMDVLMVYPAGLIMDRFGRKRAIVPCFAIQSAGMLLVPFTQDPIALLLVTMLMGFGNGLGSGSMMTVGTDLSPVEGRGEFLGVWRLIGDVGISGGPIVVGAVADVLALPAAAAAMALSGGLATLIFAVFVPETHALRRKKQP
jgi:MFS family permease